VPNSLAFLALRDVISWVINTPAHLKKETWVSSQSMGNWTKIFHPDLPRLGVWVTGTADPVRALFRLTMSLVVLWSWHLITNTTQLEDLVLSCQHSRAVEQKGFQKPPSLI
jgi:hypothetical protein